MTTVPHVLSPADSAQAERFARVIQQHAHPADRCKIARVGMDVFQGTPTPLDVELEFLAALYLLDIPGGPFEFLARIFDERDRLQAFESAVALNVHLLATNQPLPVVHMEAEHGSI
jgi:hypothetical protein